MSDDHFELLFLIIYVPFAALAFFFLLTFALSIRWKKPLSVSKKAILISGCDSGIGLRVAQHFYSKGFHLFAACLDAESEGSRLLGNRKNFSRDRMVVIKLDITNKTSINSATCEVNEKLKEWGLQGLWALINNAGICIYGEFDWLTWDQVFNQVSVNLLGTISLTKAFLPLVKEAKGRIINVGSINGICAYPGLSVYCATKFGIEGFSDVLRNELAKLGVKVILIRPGDFARLTGIMSRQKDLAAEMWDHMTSSDRLLYNNYFQDYHRYIQENYGMTSPASFEDSSLLADFEKALLSPSPPYALTVAPLQFRLFFAILSLLPPRAKDALIDFLYARVFGFDMKKYFPAKN